MNQQYQLQMTYKMISNLKYIQIALKILSLKPILHER